MNYKRLFKAIGISLAATATLFAVGSVLFAFATLSPAIFLSLIPILLFAMVVGAVYEGLE